VITPEPTAEWTPGRTGIYYPAAIAAAGHLGVIEERCDNPRHEMYLVEGMACLGCGAAV
jgi:hypothetical protein